MSDEQEQQLGEVAQGLGSLLIERRDAKAIQLENGGYNPVRENMRDPDSPLVGWHVDDIVAHIKGERTYGHYLVNPAESTVRCAVFDIDIRKKANPDIGEEPIISFGEEIDPRDIWLNHKKSEHRPDIGKQLMAMTYGLGVYVQKVLDLKVLFSYSGSKGTHVIVPLDPGTPAADARDAMRRVLDATGVMVHDRGDNFFKHADAYPALQVEMYPKQDTVESDSFGNLVRLPLGIHRSTGNRSFFLKVPKDLSRVQPDNPLLVLREGSIRE